MKPLDKGYILDWLSPYYISPYYITPEYCVSVSWVGALHVHRLSLFEHYLTMSQSDNSSNACDDDNVVRRFGVLAERSDGFKQWLLDQLQSRNCRRVLDAACGTG